MFAVGYYFCVIFWVLALSLRDWMACPVWSATQQGRRYFALLSCSGPLRCESPSSSPEDCETVRLARSEL